MSLEEFFKITKKSFYTVGVCLDKFNDKTRIYFYDEDNNIICYELLGDQLIPHKHQD